MGAQGFCNYVAGTDPAACFGQAVDEARFDHGHGGYSGTLAEKPSYVMRRRVPLPIWEARAWADQDGEQNDKWGPAFCIPVIQSVDTELGMETYEVEGMDEKERWAAIEPQLRAKYPDRAGVYHEFLPGPLPVRLGDGGALRLAETTLEPGPPTYRLLPKGYRDGSFPGSGREPLAGSDPEVLVQQLLARRSQGGRNPFSEGVVGVEEYELHEIRVVRCLRLSPPEEKPRWQMAVRVQKREAKGERGFLFYGYASS